MIMQNKQITNTSSRVEIRAAPRLVRDLSLTLHTQKESFLFLSHAKCQLYFLSNLGTVLKFLFYELPFFVEFIVLHLLVFPLRDDAWCVSLAISSFIF